MGHDRTALLFCGSGPGAADPVAAAASARGLERGACDQCGEDEDVSRVLVDAALCLPHDFQGTQPARSRRAMLWHRMRASTRWHQLTEALRSMAWGLGLVLRSQFWYGHAQDDDRLWKRHRPLT